MQWSAVLTCKWHIVFDCEILSISSSTVTDNRGKKQQMYQQLNNHKLLLCLDPLWGQWFSKVGTMKLPKTNVNDSAYTQLRPKKGEKQLDVIFLFFTSGDVFMLKVKGRSTTASVEETWNYVTLCLLFLRASGLLTALASYMTQEKKKKEALILS